MCSLESRMEKIFCLCFCLFALLVVTSGEHLLHSVAGDVGRGNYTYYSLMYDGPITLYLHSESGDADLYVSQRVTKPTFEPETYCLQSSTCGLDVIHIPRSFLRPVGIGVYGHVSHEVSIYLLEVFYREEDESERFDPYSTELNQDKQQEETAASEKKQQPEEQYSAKPKTSNLNQPEKSDTKRKSSKRKHNAHHPLDQIWRLMMRSLSSGH